MCVVSSTGDYFQYRTVPSWPVDRNYTISPEVTRGEFLELRRQMEELKKLLVASKAYDDAMGEADCETDEKVAIIKKLADQLGVDLSEVF